MSDFHVSTVTGVLWLVVTPQTITTPVPSHIDVGLPGSVQDAAYRTAKPVEAGCPITDEEGRTVGFSLNCKGSDK